MTTRQQTIAELRSILGSEVLLGYAPSLRTVFRQQLDRLLLEESIVSSLRHDLGPRRIGPERETKAGCQFLVSSLLLHESFAYLKQQPEESLHLCTGVEVDAASLVTTLVPVDLEKATVVSADADPEAIARVLLTMEHTGHHLTGVFHIHPGEGPAATRPSGTDRKYMGRLVGRNLVFGIWSRDGYCRIETLPAGRSVELFGEGIKEEGRENESIMYRLETPGRSLLGYRRRIPGGVAVGRDLVRPARTDSGI